METTYTVEGMTCGHCVAAVTEEVGQIPGVTDAKVTLEGGRLTLSGLDTLDRPGLDGLDQRDLGVRRNDRRPVSTTTEEGP